MGIIGHSNGMLLRFLGRRREVNSNVPSLGCLGHGKICKYDHKYFETNRWATDQYVVRLSIVTIFFRKKKQHVYVRAMPIPAHVGQQFEAGYNIVVAQGDPLLQGHVFAIHFMKIADSGTTGIIFNLSTSTNVRGRLDTLTEMT